MAMRRNSGGWPTGAQVVPGRARHPERWSRDTRDWTPAGPVRLNPSPEVQALKRIG
ncbi:hypothetical protein HPC50_06735 [Corallococcus exiguus]|uniref:hypothetical protein n=1 Tax=Corallococcus TaxID=83461 RepID=UPI0013158DE4|nr:MULTISPECIES: hypothetical protein [Corallococcus]NPC46770.1 hypothetical protein [Corallococcus exiguus]